MMRDLLRKTLRGFNPYVVGRPIDEVRREYGLTGRVAKLASNENPLGTSPKALEAMRLALSDVSLYPDDNAYHLRQSLASRHGVEMANVIAASGSVEVIEIAAAAFLNPGDVVASSAGSFAMYGLAAAKAGAEFRAAPMCAGFRYDLEAIADRVDDRTKIVFLANPTNPTGTWFQRRDFDAFMERIPDDVLVVYDSAYEEYTTDPEMPDPLEYFRRGRRLLLLRTFSKAYGLAGIRVGFAIGPEDIIHGLMTCRFPFNVNLVAQAAAIAAMDDHDFVLRSRAHNLAELGFLRRGLQGLPIEVPATQTNFLFIQTSKDASWLFQELQKVGIIVRPIGERAVRVSTGLREDNTKFLEHFRRLVLSSDGTRAEAGR